MPVEGIGSDVTVSKSQHQSVDDETKGKNPESNQRNSITGKDLLISVVSNVPYECSTETLEIQNLDDRCQRKTTLPLTTINKEMTHS